MTCIWFPGILDQRWQCDFLWKWAVTSMMKTTCASTDVCGETSPLSPLLWMTNAPEWGMWVFPLKYVLPAATMCLWEEFNKFNMWSRLFYCDGQTWTYFDVLQRFQGSSLSMATVCVRQFNVILVSLTAFLCSALSALQPASPVWGEQQCFMTVR